MDIKDKLVFRFLLGFTLGLLVGIATYLIFAPDGSVLNKADFIIHLVGSAIMGLVGYGGAIVYEIESWSLGRATLTHYLVSFMTMFVISELLGWFPHEVLLIVFISFSVAYAAIWITEYAVWKRQIREMNRNLEAILKKEKEFTE